MNERVSKEDFVGRVRDAWDRWERLVAAVPLSRMLEPGFFGERSLRDVIMHLSWYEEQMVQVLERREFVGSELWELQTDERNEAIYAENADRELDEILQAANRVHSRLMALLEELSDEELNDPAAFPGMPVDWMPWDVIAGNTYEHYDGHAESVAKKVRGAVWN